MVRIQIAINGTKVIKHEFIMTMYVSLYAAFCRNFVDHTNSRNLLLFGWIQLCISSSKHFGTPYSTEMDFANCCKQ